MSNRYLQPNNNDTSWFVNINTLFCNSDSDLNFNINDLSTSEIIINTNNTNIIIGDEYLKIPIGSTSQRPTQSLQNGEIRYNSTLDTIEYYISNTNTWVPITSPPFINSIEPTLIPLSDASINISGNNFSSNPSITYIGNNNQEFPLIGGSISVSNNQTLINASVPQTVIDNSNLEPFSVKVISESNLSFTFPNAFNVNDIPFFISYGGQSINTIIDISKNLLVTNTGLLDISATDPDNSIVFTSSNLASLGSGSTLSIDSANGKISGTTPSPASITTYTFNTTITDSLGSSVSKNFQFRVISPVEVTFDSTLNANIQQILYLDNGGSLINSGNGPAQEDGYTVFVIYDTTSAGYNPNDGSRDPATQLIGTFSLNTSVSNVSWLLGGGGGGGGSGRVGSSLGGGGGGAGGLVYASNQSLSGISYNLTIGGGGNGSLTNSSTAVDGLASSGANSVFNSYTANGGGYGATRYADGDPAQDGGDGGSGGGSTGVITNPQVDLPGSSTQNNYGVNNVNGYGNQGSPIGSTDTSNWYIGGGGGAQNPGQQLSGGVNLALSCDGGNGLAFNITGSAILYSGGGGGGQNNLVTDYTRTAAGTGGLGGGGTGGVHNGVDAQGGENGKGGGGGGGAGYNSNNNVTSIRGAPGGNGIFILKVPSFT
jgi:hypothetical protein